MPLGKTRSLGEKTGGADCFLKLRHLKRRSSQKNKGGTALFAIPPLVRSTKITHLSPKCKGVCYKILKTDAVFKISVCLLPLIVDAPCGSSPFVRQTSNGIAFLVVIHKEKVVIGILLHVKLSGFLVQQAAKFLHILTLTG